MKKILIVSLVLSLLLGLSGCGDTNTPVNVSQKSSSELVKPEASVAELKEPSNSPVQETTGQKNAVQSAKDYLAFSAFSFKGLVKQLEYEGYTHSEAVYAANHCDANWKEQAAKSAETYLSFTSFSRKELIEQLEYEGFSHEQAVYGAQANGY